MADTVETAIYKLRVEGQAEIDRLTKSIDGLAVAEEKATTSTRTMSQGLQNMVAKYDPLIKAQEQYRKDLEKIARAREAGTGTETQLNASFAAATQRFQAHAEAIQKVERATAGHTNATKLQRHELINMSRQLQDIGVSLYGGQSPLTVMMQQLPQLADISMSSGVSMTNMFKQAGAAALSVITPMNAVIAGIVAATAAAAALALQLDKVQKSSERALLGAGARTGTNITDLNRFVEQSSGMGGTSLSQKEARALGEDLTRTGDIVISKLRGMSDAVVGFATLTGKSMDEARKDIVQFATDPKKALDELAKTYGDFDVATQKAVEGLVLAGDKTGAFQVIMDSLAETNRKAADSMGIADKAARTLVNTLAMETMKPTGLEGQLAAAQGRLGAAQAAGPGMYPAAHQAALKALTRDVENLQRAIDKVNAARAAAEINKLATEAGNATAALTPQIAQIRQLEQAIASLERAKAAGATSKYGAAADAAALQAAQNQLQAVRESQAEAARYNQQVAQIAASWQGVGQAVALQLQQLQNELPVLQAITGAQRMAAQAAADYANAIDAGKTELEAAALAAAKLEAAQASATTSVKQQVEALKDSTEMIRAQQNGTEATTAASQAYRNAIKSGADSTAAAALSAATLENKMAGAATNAGRFASAMGGSAYDSSGYGTYPAGSQMDYFSSPNQMTGGTYGGVQVSYSGGGRGRNIGPFGSADPAAFGFGSQAAAFGSGGGGGGGGGGGAYLPGLDELNNSLKSVNDGLRPATDSIDALKDSTDKLNATTQELLSPYYTMDPRTSHIGFRSQGMAAGGYVDVPGGYSANDNLMAMVPVASGERIYVDPMTNRRGTSGGGMVINISSPITINGNANADQFGRTLYQNNQNLAKQVRAAAQ